MDLIKIINDVIEHSSHKDDRPYIGASYIGNACIRSIWYAYKNYDVDVIRQKRRLTFDIGKAIEKLILNYLDEAGCTIEYACVDNDFLLVQHSDIPDFQGHMDALLHTTSLKTIILEIKSAKNSSFNVFKKKGLKEWSKTYYTQCQAYMGLSGYKECIIIVVNKDTSEIAQELVTFDEDFYFQLVQKVKYIKSYIDPPPKINNNSCFYLCTMCNYRAVCHYGNTVSKETNELKETL